MFCGVFFKKITLIPKAIWQIKNWFVFLLNGSGLKDVASIYKLRDGTVIKVPDGISCRVIATVYLKRDYGLVEDNSIIIDIGAHIGVFSLYCAKHSKNNKVYAFEPSELNYKYLTENIGINQLQSQIIPFKCAVAGKRAKAKLMIHNISFFHSLYEIEPEARFVARSEEGIGTEEVDCIALKDIIDENEIRKCDLLKLDCQGAEYDILYSLPLDYLNRIERMVIECHNLKTCNPRYNDKSLMRYLSENGFEIKELKQAIFEVIKKH